MSPLQPQPGPARPGQTRHSPVPGPPCGGATRATRAARTVPRSHHPTPTRVGYLPRSPWHEHPPHSPPSPPPLPPPPLLLPVPAPRPTAPRASPRARGAGQGPGQSGGLCKQGAERCKQGAARYKQGLLQVVMEGLRRWAGDTDSESILFKRIRVSHQDEAELAEYIRIHIHTLKAEQA